METVKLVGHTSIQFAHKINAQRFLVPYAAGPGLDGIMGDYARVIELENSKTDGPGFGPGVNGDPSQDGVQMVTDKVIASVGRADISSVLIYSGPKALDDITYGNKQLSSSNHHSTYPVSIGHLTGEVEIGNLLATREGTQVPARFS